MTTLHQTSGAGGTLGALPSNMVVFGLECEIEGLANGGKHTACFRAVQDGSLRNNGWEYTTAFPVDRGATIQQFKGLYDTDLKFHKDAEKHSERTSTHVHLNVSNMELEHIKQLVLLYALYEEFFFAMVKPCRRDNIHCVPLTETHLPAKYSGSILQLVGAWSKYTGLNLLRMQDLGTVEFRHLHGTSDEKELNTWLHVLENLCKVSQRIIITPEALADHKQLEEWFELIFFPADKVMLLKPSLFSIIHNSLIDVKLSVAT